MYKYFILSLILLFLTGCAGLSKTPADINVTVVNIKMLESTILEQRFLVDLRIQNRSPEALSVYGMSFDIDINNKKFASGSSDQKATIGAFNDTIMEVKMSSTLIGIIRQIQAMQKNKNQSLSYVISGRVYTDSLFGSISFREADEFDFSQPYPGPANPPLEPITNDSTGGI